MEQIRTDLKNLSPTVIPQLQTEVKVNTKINKSQKSMSVLVKAMQELVSYDATEKPVENSILDKPNSSEIFPATTKSTTPNY
ncbi:hypothetical protein [Calothrix sp. CCY 0018]|uniref:hypothetical protein n=1 Tax=Calothrix sp. CCY 0018 TaxID=3103864 RepID=UPI0039C6269C